ncbi:MAG: MFS transporter [Candidatus Bathyarchaeota archaeon]|nr:MAG: MFS transporter [Candidatus Bathyarchaeota archaeon]
MEDDRSRLLLALFAVVFLTSTGYGTVTFLTPVYAEELGASYVALGVMGSLGSAVYTVMTLVSGILLDRFERIRFYLVSLIVGVFIVSLFCITTSLSQVILLRGLLGIVSAAFWVASSTLTVDISPKETLSRSVGRFNQAWIVGFIVGPVVGGYIADTYGFHLLFAVLAILLVSSVVITLRVLVPNLRLRHQNKAEGFDLSLLKCLAYAYLTLLPFAVVLGIYMAIIPGHMSAQGISGSVIGMFLTMTNAVRGIGFFNAERSVRWGTTRSLMAAAAITCTAMVLMAFSESALSFFLPLVLYGTAAGIVTPVLLDYIANSAPQKALGTAMGVHEGVYGVGMSFGSIVGGYLADAYGPAVLYLLLAVIAAFMIPFSVKLDDDVVREE